MFLSSIKGAFKQFQILQTHTSHFLCLSLEKENKELWLPVYSLIFTDRWPLAVAQVTLELPKAKTTQHADKTISELLEGVFFLIWLEKASIKTIQKCTYAWLKWKSWCIDKSISAMEAAWIDDYVHAARDLHIQKHRTPKKSGRWKHLHGFSQLEAWLVLF